VEQSEPQQGKCSRTDANSETRKRVGVVGGGHRNTWWGSTLGEENTKVEIEDGEAAKEKRNSLDERVERFDNGTGNCWKPTAHLIVRFACAGAKTSGPEGAAGRGVANSAQRRGILSKNWLPGMRHQPPDRYPCNPSLPPSRTSKGRPPHPDSPRPLAVDPLRHQRRWQGTSGIPRSVTKACFKPLEDAPDPG